MKNTQAVHATCLDMNKAEWLKMSNERVRLDLSYEEFQRIKGKYAAVVAVPIMTETDGKVQFRGCVAADVRWGGTFDTLFNGRTVEILTDAAATIANELSYLPRWTLWK